MIHILKELGFDYSERSNVSETVEELAKLRGLDVNSLHVPEVVILSLSVGVTNLLVKEFNAKEVPWIYRARPLYVGHCDGVDVGIIWASPGAPLAAMVMEHLIACGAKYIIGIGLIATIQSDIDIGTLVIPIKAIRGEGTSYYYLPKNVEAVANENILQALRRACKELGVGYIEGEIYTTDAIHRETKKLIEALRKRKVICIDMETSAIYAVGIYHKVKVGCVLIVSTNPRTKSIGFYSNSLNESISKAIKVLKNAIKLFVSNEETSKD